MITQADQLNTAFAHDAASTMKYHRLKFYFCLIAAAAAFLLLFQFRGLLLLLGPYGFIASPRPASSSPRFGSSSIPV